MSPLSKQSQAGAGHRLLALLLVALLWAVAVLTLHAQQNSPSQSQGPSKAAQASPLPPEQPASKTPGQPPIAPSKIGVRTDVVTVFATVRDKKGRILSDLTKADPLVTFKQADIAFVYGSKWKQRYFQKVGDDYFPLGAQWDVSHQIWRAYHVPDGADWWTKYYPQENSARPDRPDPGQVL